MLHVDFMPKIPPKKHKNAIFSIRVFSKVRITLATINIFPQLFFRVTGVLVLAEFPSVTPKKNIENIVKSG